MKKGIFVFFFAQEFRRSSSQNADSSDWSEEKALKISHPKPKNYFVNCIIQSALNVFAVNRGLMPESR